MAYAIRLKEKEKRRGGEASALVCIRFTRTRYGASGPALLVAGGCEAAEVGPAARKHSESRPVHS